MGIAFSTVIGFFFGFSLGVGCALAVMYSIYTGGYRAALEDSLRPEHSDRYRNLLPRAQARVAAQTEQK